MLGIFLLLRLAPSLLIIQYYSMARGFVLLVVNIRLHQHSGTLYTNYFEGKALISFHII